MDKAFITEGEEGERIAKVRIREQRMPNLGDKFASRAGQKGTVGMIIPEKDMPFTKDGIRPDIIVNPHAIPTRMTIGQLVECITGKASAMYGAFADCTALNNAGSKIGVYGELLNKAGYHSSGNEILYNGMTGEQIESHIFIGPNYYMRLKHMVKDKINFRARGPRTALTRQPVSGRANDGGLRIGEMERDVLISHGISNFLTESMTVRGDQCYLAVCNLSGMTAIYNPDKNLFMSPMADGPIQFATSIDGKTTTIDHITRFGRDFSVVSIPYTMKLLIQELQTINVQLRIITEDNISQIESMAYSNNLEKLSLIPNATPGKIIERVKSSLQEANKPRSAPTSESPIAETPDVEDIPYADVSPAYVPPSPEYPNGSPAYMPESPDYKPGSPSDYRPGSPDYKPGGPTTPTQPTTPEFSPPPPPTMMETAMNTITGLFKGGAKEPVYYRGSEEMGLPPNHKWRVKRIGDQFITIETDDMPGTAFAKGDSTMVVHPSEVIPCSSVSEPEFFRDYMPYGSQSEPNQNHSPSVGLPPGNGSGGIQFNPVIKIVNGDDNSRNQGKPAVEMSNTNSSNDDWGEMDGGNNGGNPIVFKEHAGEKPSVEHQNGESSSGGGGGLFNSFKNFVIKKLS